MVAHEVASASGGVSDVPPPGLVERSLELAARSDGRSTPCLAGNVLVYLTEVGRLVALDHGGTGTLFLASGVDTAALRLRGGEIIGAVSSQAGTRYLAWDVRALRAALAAGDSAVPPRQVEATGVHLLGLPTERTRLHQGAGLLRLVVEHDPVIDEHAELYRAATGARPGDYLVRRVCNPLGPATPHPDLRPVRLSQVPVPVPGGVFLIGAMRWFGRAVDGALLVPTVPGYVAHA